MRRDYDLAILGGGCAGLSLASRLAAASSIGTRIAVVEPRQSYVDDRTWCFWQRQATAFDDLLTKRWARWRLSAGDREVVRGSASAPYAMLRSAAFYRQAVERISPAPHIDLLLGTMAGELSPLGDGPLRIETSNGTITADWVLDSRPTGPVPRRSDGLLQCFAGWEVETAEPSFDCDVVDLMRFYERGDGSVSFFYLLPTTANRALIEATSFRRQPIAVNDLERDLAAELERRFGARTSYRIKRREAGTIPMTTAPPRPTLHPRHLRIGTAGGAVRASSGYAFVRIQRWAEACAESITRDGVPLVPSSDRLLLSWLDSIFLRAIAAHPEAAPGYFLGLFENVPSDTLLRFLDDEASVLDMIRVMSALPTWPFLVQAARVA